MEDNIEKISSNLVGALHELKAVHARAVTYSAEMDTLRNENALLKKQLRALGIEPAVYNPYNPSLSVVGGDASFSSLSSATTSTHRGKSTSSRDLFNISTSVTSLGAMKDLPSPRKGSLTTSPVKDERHSHRHTRNSSSNNPLLESSPTKSLISDSSGGLRLSVSGGGSTSLKRQSGIADIDEASGPLSFEEDSPMFTDTLKTMQEVNENLAKKLKQILKSVHLLVSSESTSSISAHVSHTASESAAILAFSQALLQLLDEGDMREKQYSFIKDKVDVDILGEGVEMLGNHLGTVVQHLIENFTVLLKNFEKNLVEPIEKFRKKVADLPGLANEYLEKQIVYEKEMKSYLLMKRKEKPEKIAEKEADTMAARKDWEVARFKYVRYMNEIEVEKRTELMLAMQVSLAEFINFFTSGNELSRQYSDGCNLLGKKLLCEKLSFVEADRKWTLLKQEVEVAFSRGAFPVDAETRRKKAVSIFSTSSEFKGWKGVTHQGYLYKRSSSLVKDWKKRWFVMHGGVLYYYQEKGKKKTTSQSLRKFAKSIDVQMNEMERVCDIMLCTAKILDGPNDLRFTFEIISPGNRTYTLQAENEAEFNAWISALRAEIENRLGINNRADRPSNNMTTNPDKFIAMNRLIESSTYCADCGSEAPDWAVINLGITVCINCSGVHRMLGTQISKVRSISLDEWRLPLLNLMSRIGNERSNEVYYHNSNPSKPLPSITSESERAEREKFIRMKYEKKLFINKLEDEDASKRDISLYEAAVNDDIELVILLYANGANIDYMNKETGKNVLHAAVEADRPICVEWLFQNGVDSKINTLSNVSLHELPASDEMKAIIKSHEES